MRCMFRADASLHLGIGHVMRCLTLARRIREHGGETIFVSRAYEGHLAHVLEEQGIEVRLLEADVASERVDAEQSAEIARDWRANRIVVDHYGLAAEWEGAQDRPVMALDDAPNRKHKVGLLLDQNYSADLSAYRPLLPAGARIMAGTEFALLRPEFARLRQSSLQRRAQNRAVRDVLLTMGGTDFPNATGWVLTSLADIDATVDMRFTVVMGPTAPHLNEIRTLAQNLPRDIRVLSGADNMASLMHDADIAIGAAGSTAWERCAMGLPTVTLVLADNQRLIAQALQSEGAACTVAFGDEGALRDTVAPLLSSTSTVAELSANAARLCDGRGTDRVVSELEAYNG